MPVGEEVDVFEAVLMDEPVCVALPVVALAVDDVVPERLDVGDEVPVIVVLLAVPVTVADGVRELVSVEAADAVELSVDVEDAVGEIVPVEVVRLAVPVALKVGVFELVAVDDAEDVCEVVVLLAVAVMLLVPVALPVFVPVDVV